MDMKEMNIKTTKDIAMNTINIIRKACHSPYLLLLFAFFCTAPTSFGQSMGMTASEGDYLNKVKISWEFTGFTTTPSSVEIKRDGQQIGYVSNNVILYFDDADAIPGVIYEYQVVPRDVSGIVMSCSDDTDFGFVFPNGSISGTVSSPYGAGVEGIVVEAAGWVNDGNFNGYYSFFDTTDIYGEYEIEHIFYYDDATFTISPSKPGHSFLPSTRERSLDLMSSEKTGVDFTDTTVLSLSGTVTYQGTSCPVPYVEIYLDYNSTGILTDSDGEYHISINDVGTHTISVEYLHHDFAQTEQTLNVQDDMTGVDFYDTETDTLTISLRSGCNTRIVDSVEFKISSVNSSGCFDQNIWSDASSVLEVVLPAQEYYVELINVWPFNTTITEQFVSPIEINMTERDTVTETVTDTTYVTTPADTTIYANGDTVITAEETNMYVEGEEVSYAKQPEVNFVYHAGTNIEVSNLPDTICVPGYNSVYLMLQDMSYPIVVRINESYTYNEVTSTCYLDTGTVDVYDMISEIGQTDIKIEDSYGIYEIAPQNINLAEGGDHPHQRMMQLDIGNDSEFIWAFIDGHQPRTQTFITKTPELPFLVLHDPPGDGSYASVTEGSSWTRSYAQSVNWGGAAGVYWDCKYGSSFKLGFAKITNYFQTKGEILAGRNNSNQSVATTTWQASETFSTSSSNLLIGNDADLYIGGAMNMIYGLTDVLEYDEENCEIVRDTTIFWNIDSLATTYVYTEEYINNTLIPNLETLRNLSQGDSVEVFQSYIDVWEQVVTNNDQVRTNALENPIENISFSGGTSMTKSKTFGASTSSNISYTVFLNVDVALGFGHEVELAGMANTSIGVKAKFNWSQTQSESSTDSESTTRTYHFADDDLGDYFSVDIARDSVYGTPVFGIVAGTSSCPHEPGTQPRDTASITLDHYVENGVDPNGQAVFTVNLVNNSESGETRGYYVGMNTASNHDGAKVRLGGQYVTAGSIFYSLEPNMSTSVPMIVERGPLAYDYEDLQLRIYPFCYGLTEYLYAIGKWTVEFDVHFAHQCSNVSIFSPENNWLVNQSDGDIMQIVLSDYSTSNQYLENIIIQYRRMGLDWNTATIIPKSDLTQDFYDFAWDVSSLDDGVYELRAKAICDFDGDPAYTYSLISSGTIDRYALELFGTPEPADGVLNINDDISVSFTEDIECQLANTPPDVELTRDDTGESIPVEYSCYENTMILKTDPNNLIDSLEGVVLTAYVNNVQDLNYNMFSEGVEWSFIVNRSPVYWSPPNMEISVAEGEAGVMEAILVNEAGVAKNFTVSGYDAAWLTPSATSGTIVSGGTSQIDFTVSSSLTTGMYQDTVQATIDGKESHLYLTVYVLNPSPWNFVNTGVNHSLFIPYNAFDGVDINEGDYIGVFFDSLGTQKCGGYVDWNNQSCAISAWSTEIDSFGNSAYNGFAMDEEFAWQVWNIDNGYSFTIVPSYATIDFPNQGLFTPDGLSGIIGFSTENVQGCMDPFANNYNPNATVDDGSCTYNSQPVPWDYTITGNNHTVILFTDADRYTINGTTIEVGDYIGAFFTKTDGSLGCAGYREWEAFSSNQAITLWAASEGNDGFAEGEAIKWKIWDASEGVEAMGVPVYDTVNFDESSIFVIDGVSALDSLYSRPFQEIIMMGHPNWNLISTYMDPDNPAVEDIFAEVEYGLGLVKNGDGQVYWPMHNVNLIGDITIGEAYQVKLSTTDSLSIHVKGAVVDAENTTLNLPVNWSYLGYLHESPQAVVDMMSSLVADLYIMKDGLGRTYIPQWNVNNIGNMLPGMGYQIKLNNANTFSYPAASSAKSSAIELQTGHPIQNSDMCATGTDMTLLIPDRTWNMKPAPGTLIRVYSEGKLLVGASTYQGGNTAITIWGDDLYYDGINGMKEKERFSIRLVPVQVLDKNGESEILFVDEIDVHVDYWHTGDATFKNNKLSIVGKAEVLGIDNIGSNLFQNVPNPCHNETTISFYLAEDTNVELSVYSVIGELQEILISAPLNKGKHMVQLDTENYESAIYLYTLTAGDFTSTRQLSVVR